MPVKALTNKTLEALKAQAKRYEVHDLLCPGMSVRVSAQGQKVFSVKFRYGLNQKRMKLGVYPRITLATAREKAMDILRQVDEGIDPDGSSVPLKLAIQRNPVAWRRSALSPAAAPASRLRR